MQRGWCDKRRRLLEFAAQLVCNDVTYSFTGLWFITTTKNQAMQIREPDLKAPLSIATKSQIQLRKPTPRQSQHHNATRHQIKNICKIQPIKPCKSDSWFSKLHHQQPQNLRCKPKEFQNQTYARRLQYGLIKPIKAVNLKSPTLETQPSTSQLTEHQMWSKNISNSNRKR